MRIEDIRDYLSIFNKVEFDKTIDIGLKELKQEAISYSNEILANQLWCLEQVLEIQKLFVSSYDNIKNAKHFNAWCNYGQIEIIFSFLRRHMNFEHNLYNLVFVEKYSNKYQKLFPYRYFMSREALVKTKKCSICGKNISIRNQCEHKLGDLYMGEMCCHQIVDFEFLALAIIRNPMDKYTVLFPKDMEYDYTMLDNLFSRLLTPYDRWNLSIEKKIKPEYEHIGRNDKCSCGSGKNYKKCCFLSGKDSTEHYKFTLIDNPNAQRIAYIPISTWKSPKI